MSRRSFRSWLARDLEHFVALKRASGIRFVSQESILLAFDRAVDSQWPRSPLRREAVIEYLASHDWTPPARDVVVSVLWNALGHARLHGADIDPLPRRPPSAPRPWRQRPPRIVSDQEMAKLLAAARQLTPARNLLRPATLATLIGLLYTTGLRIGEALGLDVGDLDRNLGILTVVRGKFGKSRALPLRDSTVRVLVRYIENPRRRISTAACSPIFASFYRRRLRHQAVYDGLDEVCDRADIPKPWPRPHDLRHTFAVRRVAQWYAEGRSVDQLLPALSTYLGHCSIENTRLYLTANGALLEQAGARFARRTRALEQVES